MSEQEQKRFNVEDKTRLMAAISKVFVSDGGITEETTIHCEFGVMDPSNCAMIMGISEQAKRILAQYANPEKV